MTEICDASETLLETSGRVERVEVDVKAEQLAVQRRDDAGSWLHACPLYPAQRPAAAYPLPPNALLDHAGAGLACFLLSGQGSDTGVIGLGAVDLATGAAIWQPSGAGRWLAGTEASYWMNNAGETIRVVNGGRASPPAWELVLIDQRREIEREAQERQQNEALVLQTASPFFGTEEEGQALTAFAADRLGSRPLSPVLFASLPQRWALLCAVQDGPNRFYWSLIWNEEHEEERPEKVIPIAHDPAIPMPDGFMLWKEKMIWLERGRLRSISLR